ncbi:hypothetical protein T440DRAFT_504301 [Plenodomus tracheiphilus IPT5]|uniref:WSC domain-containing protein n=1 Tax=Plenodomus tracheiphilus IPT5 TaxID=1408161 RepID=A0A6A7BJP1_9PLEO|nr:hypothetical protein T440DRAFT_504301 [Plenodomus tracheiphilus IPT5]
MKAFGYLIAGAALLPELVSGLSPAANDVIWSYQGCYSDKLWNIVKDPVTNQNPPYPIPPAVHGVPGWPRTLNGLFSRNTTSQSGKACREYCASYSFRFAATNNDKCWCDNAIAINGTNATAPSYGIRDPDDRFCQQQCPGTPGEACGNNSMSGNNQRVSVYMQRTAAHENVRKPGIALLELSPFLISESEKLEVGHKESTGLVLYHECDGKMPYSYCT